VQNKPEALERWTIGHAADLYGIRQWSAGCFDISQKGEVEAIIRAGDREVRISLPDIVAGLKARGLDMPVLLRFSNILESRVSLLNETFVRAMREAGYRGGYRAVFPVKVNQQQHVIEEIVEAGRPYHHGLEVGSKAELIVALAYLNDPEAHVVCNGYKDEEFIELALFALKMGVRVVLVVEMPNEVDAILDCAERLGVKPQLGVRVKLSSRAAGHWTESGGDRSRFGLTTSQIIGAVDRLRQRGRLDCLRMLHYHLGSQISNIGDIRTAIREAARFYVDLVQEGAPMGLLDVGGGLAVDYDGSHTNFSSSSNYGIPEYSADIIETVMTVLDESSVAHPVILSESGRAIVAYHSVLVFNILDTSRLECSELEEELPEDAHEMLHSLRDAARSLTRKNAQEGYHDAIYYRDEIRSLFLHGAVTLRERALSERLFLYIATRIVHFLEDQSYVPDEMEGLERALADVYHGNFSVFQSLPDSWAIKHLFPVMPIHRLNEFPSRRATLADITCDCDGKIDRFTDLHDVKMTLPLHELGEDDYYLGVFLVGAYQETLGALHNLLGDTNVVAIYVDADGAVEYSREIGGDAVADVLSYVEYDPKDLIRRVKRLAEQSVREGRIRPEERRQIVEAYEAGLRGYTYFEQ